jgi:hypothetical protein
MKYTTRQGQRFEVETLETGIVLKPRRNQTNSFAKVPLDWAGKAAKATRTPQAIILVVLLRKAWEAKGSPFPFTNAALVKYGVTREIKRRTLAALESAGLAKVERRHGRAPIVTLIGIPD